MSPDDLATRGRALYGERWQTPLAHDLGVADRTVRRWLAGETPIPGGVDSELRKILESRWNTIGGFMSYGVNLSGRLILHFPTATCFRIEDDDSLTLLSVMPASEELELIAEGATEVLRRERERDPRVVGQFVWG
jgi:hypothetical protein